MTRTTPHAHPRRGAGGPLLRFLGAAGTVTGSRFLLEGRKARSWWTRASTRAWRTCGAATGRRSRCDPSTISEVVLTHAHLDHVGYLPRLVKDGFRGRVTCTPETAELAAIVLRDSAHLQQEDAAYANAHGFSKHRPGPAAVRRARRRGGAAPGAARCAAASPFRCAGAPRRRCGRPATSSARRR